MTTNKLQPEPWLIVSAESGESFLVLDPEEEGSLEFDLQDVVDELRDRGVAANIENTGGGTMCIYAGEVHQLEEDGYVGDRWAALAGPAYYDGPDGPILGNVADFAIGPDRPDQEFSLWCAELGITTAWAVAELIFAQTRLPYGTCLTIRQARAILKKAARTPVRRALIALLGRLSRRSERGNKIRPKLHDATCWCRTGSAPAAPNPEGGRF